MMKIEILVADLMSIMLPPSKIHDERLSRFGYRTGNARNSVIYDEGKRLISVACLRHKLAKAVKRFIRFAGKDNRLAERGFSSRTRWITVCWHEFQRI